MSIIFHPAAEREFSDAFQWYDKQVKGLGAEFFKAIDEAIQRIENTPLIFPVCYMTLRKAVIKNFPYIILFQIVRADIKIIAIFHTSRNPFSWTERK